MFNKNWNIIIGIFLIILVLAYFRNYSEGFGGTVEERNAEAIANVASLYNTDFATITNLTTTGALTAMGTTNLKGPIVIDGAIDILPRGMIMAWWGTKETIPKGWVICDGADGKTPDLRNRFIVGAGDEYGLNATGGANTVTLNINQIPNHEHQSAVNVPACCNVTSTVLGNGGNMYSGGGGANFGIGGTPFVTSKVGGGKSHENRPPYYALFWIMKK